MALLEFPPVGGQTVPPEYCVQNARVNFCLFDELRDAGAILGTIRLQHDRHQMFGAHDAGRHALIYFLRLRNGFCNQTVIRRDE